MDVAASTINRACTSSQCASKYGSIPGNGLFIAIYDRELYGMPGSGMRDIVGPLRTSKEPRPAAFHFCILVKGDVRFPANDISRPQATAQCSGHLFLPAQPTAIRP